MANVNDPGQYEKKYDKAKKRLETADIDDEDRKAIEGYIKKKKSDGKHEYSTLSNYTTTLTRAAEMAHKPLTEWEPEDPENGQYTSDYVVFVEGLADGSLDGAKDGGYSENYVRSFRLALKPFMRYLGRDWSEDISIGRPNKGKITEEDCFTSDETARMFAEADERDSAMIALWLATGQRASALASLRLGDVELTDNRGRFDLNPEAIGLKGAEGMRPMIWAMPYVKRWVNNHPRRGDNDAALFCCKRNGADYEKGDPMTYEGIRRAVETLCANAGIPEEKAETHRFRHTAIRRMIRDGMSEQQIKYMVGWHEDSTQLARYGDLADETHASDIESEYGISEDDGATVEIGTTFDNCPKCDVPLSEMVSPSFCPECGLPLEHDDEQVEETRQQAANDALATIGDAAKDENEQVEAVATAIAKKLLESDDDELIRQLLADEAE